MCILLFVACNDFGVFGYALIIIFYFTQKGRKVLSLSSSVHDVECLNTETMEELAVNGQFSGVEKEVYEPFPFDTEKLSVTTKPLPLSTIIRRLKRNLIIAAEIQRDSDLWDLGRKSRLIESILLKLPLPLFYASEGKDGILYIVDGLQRISAIRAFMDEKKGFKLNGLEFLKLDGKMYKDLSEEMQIRMEETDLQFVIIGADSPPEVQRNIFKRLNTGGLPLSEQEIRHALYFGASTDFLKRLVNTKQFKKATDNSINDSRMAGRELILRFVAFFMFGMNEYRTNYEMDAFLCDAMQIINGSPIEKRNIKCDDIIKVEEAFILAMERASKLFGDSAFRMNFRYKGATGARRSAINKSLFEVWSVTLALICDEDFNKLLERCDRLLSEIAVIHDDNFKRICGSDASLTGAVKARYQVVNSVIKKILEDKT
jgi:hypothetical protein